MPRDPGRDVHGRRCDGRPVILFYNDVFGRPVDTGAIACCDRCVFTTDRRRLAEAAAVVFHIPSLGGIRKVRKYPGQVWVAWSMESRVAYPMLADERFMRHFEIRMTYERSADIWCPYLPTEDEFRRALATPPAAKTADAPAIMLQSATFDRSGRNAFAVSLLAQMKVHSYGRFLNNRKLETADLGRPTKLALLADYKFYLGFENAITVDYVTEKFFDPLLAGSVPVYRGAPNVAMFAPGDHAYIDATAFASAGELARFLTRLDGDPEAYRRYFAWREGGLSAAFRAMLSATAKAPFCRLCDAVIERRAARRRSWWLPSVLAPRVALR